MQTRECGSQLNCYWWGTPTRTYVAVLQHGPLSLYTKLEGPFIAKLDSISHSRAFV
jgi:hypothetical protein